jgi:hypothetical protein
VSPEIDIPNRVTGESLPGVCFVTDVKPFMIPSNALPLSKRRRQRQKSPNQALQATWYTRLTTRVRIKNRKGDAVDPDKIMDGLSKELNSALKAMSKTKDINEKEVYSRIIKNLCESQGVFLKLATEMMPLDFDDDLEEEDIPF